MTSQTTDVAFLAEAARLASEPVTEQAVQSILSLSAAALGGGALDVPRLSGRVYVACFAGGDGSVGSADRNGDPADVSRA